MAKILDRSDSKKEKDIVYLIKHGRLDLIRRYYL